MRRDGSSNPRFRKYIGRRLTNTCYICRRFENKHQKRGEERATGQIPKFSSPIILSPPPRPSLLSSIPISSSMSVCLSVCLSHLPIVAVHREREHHDEQKPQNGRPLAQSHGTVVDENQRPRETKRHCRPETVFMFLRKEKKTQKKHTHTHISEHNIKDEAKSQKQQHRRPRTRGKPGTARKIGA